MGMSKVSVQCENTSELFFDDTFIIGRDPECGVIIDSGLVSRKHVRIAREGGLWYVQDLGSMNGVLVGGERISSTVLDRSCSLQLGVNGPVVKLGLVGADTPAKQAGARPAAEEKDVNRERTSPSLPVPEHQNGNDVAQYIDHYFGESDQPAGEHTQFIRIAYNVVQKKQRRAYTGIILAIALLCVMAILYAVYQDQRRSELEGRATAYFVQSKQLDLLLVSLKKQIDEAGVNVDLDLVQLDKVRQQNAMALDGYIRELGIYRGLNEQEKAIYDVARIFNENGFGMPASFVGEVLEEINTFWLIPRNRERFVQAIQHAESMGYTSYIVQRMQERQLPPEFFYLALVESDMRVEAVGPLTRWGIAKGMWQFIPSTGAKYGLSIGPRSEQEKYDMQDDRHDFYKSTDAATLYLRHIYTTLAQASGLLVMASYNWGEHRVAPRLSGLSPESATEEELFAGVPADPDHRNYWAFLTQYQDRMEDQTKEYVLRIFSAAVIGHNPRLWGFDFDNPLLPHMKQSEP